KDKADKLAQAKIDKEAKDKADKLAQAKANIANLNKNALANEMNALKIAEQKDAQAKLRDAAKATSHDAEDRALAEKQLADKKAAEKLALENSNKDLASLMDKYTRQIQKAIKQQWNKPPNTEKLSATVRITVFPDGEVRNIYISKSSGNDAFDASIKAAIDKASPLPVPKDNQALNEKFRLLTFNFGSED
ncbi:MAG: cell envelope integrity protein TolA, partial [Moraxellaceae bacterium]|nr:cell envelope integrity protein TolA [Moraxellaceae bacterium]